jgi:hypothetical protein
MKGAATPDAYVAGLTGWQRALVESLRALARKAAVTEEHVKWGHLVYVAGGPVFLIRAEETRVLLGFWRGRRLVALEPGLVPSGKYEMATLVLREDSRVAPATVRRLVRQAVALNAELGDPRDAAVRKGPKRRAKA